MTSQFKSGNSHQTPVTRLRVPLIALAAAMTLALGGCQTTDPYTGELPMAYVVTTIDSKISEGELLDYCKQEISERAAIPKRIIFVEAMPLTVIGKVFRPLLRQMISETIISEHLLSESIPATVSSEIEKKRGLVNAMLKLAYPLAAPGLLSG